MYRSEGIFGLVMMIISFMCGICVERIRECLYFDANRTPTHTFTYFVLMYCTKQSTAIHNVNDIALMSEVNLRHLNHVSGETRKLHTKSVYERVLSETYSQNKGKMHENKSNRLCIVNKRLVLSKSRYIRCDDVIIRYV